MTVSALHDASLRWHSVFGQKRIFRSYRNLYYSSIKQGARLNKKVTLHSDLLPSKARRYGAYLAFASAATLLVYFHKIHPTPPHYQSEFVVIKDSMVAFSQTFGNGFIKEKLLLLIYVVFWACLVGLITAVVHECTHYIAVPGFGGRARFGMNRRKFIPSLIPQIRLSKHHYIAIALAPLIFVNFVCIVVYSFADIAYSLTAFAIFLINTIGSAGDFFSAIHVGRSQAIWFVQSEDRLSEYYKK